jgi:prepilin-type N-terminal cleavage/methylation domain-containing protein
MALAKNRSSSAFTLLELLVVIAIIGVLVGLLLPAVQKIREAANRMACGNNLKQLGLAVHAYHDTHQHIPYSRIEGYATWAVLLMPYLEQSNLYQAWRMDKTYYDQAAPIPRTTPVPVYFCPSRRTAATPPQASISGDVSESAGGAHTPGTLADYACSANSLGYWDTGWATSNPPADGAFIKVKSASDALTFAAITDGLTNTIFLGEKHVPIGQFGVGDNFWDCSTYNGDRKCAFRAANVGLAQSPSDTTTSFGSYHQGVCQFVMGDSSVRAISTTIPVSTLKLLVGRKDGRVAPDY